MLWPLSSKEKGLAQLGMSAVPLEVTSAESIAACKAEVERLTGGRLDILVNNAGRSHTVPALDIELDDLRATYETNVFAPLMLCQALAPQLIAARGLVVNISSLSTQVPYLFRAAYSSSKAALAAWSRVLRLEMRPFGVRVMVVTAGTVRSNIASHAERQLPGASLYRPIEDVFRRYLRYSQETATMDTAVFAERVVREAIRGESWCGGLVGGTPYYFWLGGMSRLVWTAQWLPSRFFEIVTGMYYGVGKISRQIALATKRD
ncbi:NADPH-dependent 1-acyldihydroxyacetone phosphate reductase [Escovopsis weberi]|uniref:NADPH-dependent 1-acyldihydroxyacetone phosphate reductase n=1 Tax=Escovopsis weberi TaxID=150374 RepID=A0A0M8N892_ESCWE|nr:NADPH-dependent 1-acyldihydroxyacetone phosphate reductase [Escovopsis weberi]